MTPERIAEIRADLAAILQGYTGPWHADELWIGDSDSGWIADGSTSEMAEFLAAAPTYLQELLAEVERLREDADRWVAYVLAFTALGRQITGLPVDFQIQQQSHANATTDGARSALGIRRALSRSRAAETAGGEP